MRIRQVRPEFFTDATIGRLSPEVRLTYIGLWCVADDAGYLDWDVDQIGALLYPYQSVRTREGIIERAGQALIDKRRLMVFPDCEHRLIPTLTQHQRIGGNKSFSVRDKHLVHTRMDESARNVTLGEGITREGLRERIGSYEDILRARGG